MPARKATPAASSARAPAKAAKPKLSRRARRGNSHTTLSRSELEQMLLTPAPGRTKA